MPSTGSFATMVAKGSAIANKLFSVATFAEVLQKPGFLRDLTGPSSTEADARQKIAGRTDPGMPVTRITDLTSTAGDRVSVDLFNVVRGKPVIGDADAEGTGVQLTSSTMEINIDLLTKVVDSGGKMSQQRTKHELRNIAKAELAGYFPALFDQQAIVHLAGARGSDANDDWIVPLQSDSDFDPIMINPVRAPTYNRHLVVSADTFAQGGTNLTTIDTTDALTLDHLLRLKTAIDERKLRLQSVRLKGDKMQGASRLWLLYVSPRQYETLKVSAGSRLETLQANALKRASFAGQHPVFNSDSFLFEGILVNKLPYTIRFAGGESTKIITQANEATETETSAQVGGASGASALAGFAVDRALLLGAQGLGDCYGKNQASAYYFEWLENFYNFERALEVGGAAMNGKAKLRFKYNEVPTDHGVCVIDSAVPLT
jgi:N4-gp56 family major capsid protein